MKLFPQAKKVESKKDKNFQILLEEKRKIIAKQIERQLKILEECQKITAEDLAIIVY